MKAFATSSVAALALAAAAPALAQVEGDWSGFYVGGQLGYGFQPSDNSESILFDTTLDGGFGDTVRTTTGANAFSPGFCGGAANGSTPASGCRGDRDGVDWKVHAGADRQFGSFVVGVVGEYGRATIVDHVSGYSTTPAFYTMTRRLRDNASIRARAGVAFGDTLAYGTAGGAWGKVRNSFTTSNGANAFADNGNDDAWGYRVGGGLEQRVAPNFSIGAQYLYTSLKDRGYRVNVTQGTAPATNPFLLANAAGTDFRRSGGRFNSHVAAVTANFRF